MLLNFNDGEERLNKFLGSEKKTTILYEGTLYMLEYPDPIRSSKLKDILSYKNNQFSEHIGSSIFRACGFDVQETVMGTFTDKTGKEKVVVGCKDFTQDGSTLYEISKLANQAAVSRGKLDATIENVVVIIDDIQMIRDKNAVLRGFWDMFVIGNSLGEQSALSGILLVKQSIAQVHQPMRDSRRSQGIIFTIKQVEHKMPYKRH